MSSEEHTSEQNERLKTRSKSSQRLGRVFVILPLLLLLAIGTAHAQTNATAQPLQLNLHQAIELALKQNPSVQIAGLNLAESQKDSAIARSALLPQADFNVSDRAIRANIRAGIGLTIPCVP